MTTQLFQLPGVIKRPSFLTAYLLVAAIGSRLPIHAGVIRLQLRRVGIVLPKLKAVRMVSAQTVSIPFRGLDLLENVVQGRLFTVMVFARTDRDISLRCTDLCPAL